MVVVITDVVFQIVAPCSSVGKMQTFQRNLLPPFSGMKGVGSKIGLVIQKSYKRGSHRTQRKLEKKAT